MNYKESITKNELDIFQTWELCLSLGDVHVGKTLTLEEGGLNKK